MSKNEKIPSLPLDGIAIGRSVGNVFSDVEIVGFQTGIKIDHAVNNTFSSVRIISQQAHEVLEETKIQLSKLEVDYRVKNDINKAIEDIKEAPTRESAVNSYMKLMSSLSDHVTVLGPLWPNICLLASSLIS